jgi:hypothetical protein
MANFKILADKIFKWEGYFVNDPSQEKFEKGWMKRLDDLK